MKMWNRVIVFLAAAVLFSACASESGKETETHTITVEKISQINSDYSKVSYDLFTFFSESGTRITSVADKEAIANDYDLSAFVREGDFCTYTGDKYYTQQGIDVSSYAGEIDWEKVADAGIDFVFIRIGYRGYTQGELYEDSMFAANYEGARENGLSIGVYFFSQAISEEEAAEEASFVLEVLGDKTLDLPVVYDPETVEDSSARTAGLDGEQMSANTLSFAQVIEEAGLSAALYCNAYSQAKLLDMSMFNDLTIWYADFYDTPQSPYHFEYWQYEDKGSVDGFAQDVYVDMNVHILYQ